MKTEFLIERDGVQYQGRLPLEVMEQYSLSQYCYNQLNLDGETSKSTAEIIELRKKMAEMILPHCNALKDGKNEILVRGKATKDFTLKHLLTLIEIYQEELIFPLLV